MYTICDPGNTGLPTGDEWRRKTAKQTVLAAVCSGRMQSHTMSRVRGYSLRLSGKDAEDCHVQQLNTPKTLPGTFTASFHEKEAVQKTLYRRLGRTDMFLSKMSLGGGPFGGLYGSMSDDADKIIKTAIRKGVNYLDTSYWYGQSRSEQTIGMALRDIPRSSYYIGTKVGRYELDYARVFDLRADSVLQSLQDSLRRLKLDYVDVVQLQIHDSVPSDEIILNETLPALQMAKESGKARYIGITGYPLDKLAAIVQASPVQIDVVLSYSRGTMPDNALVQYLPFFQRQNVGVMNGSSLSMGMLTPQGPPAWHPAPERVKRACLSAVQYCQSKGLSMARLAGHYSMNLPGISTCLIGVNSLKMLNEDLDISWSSHLTETEMRVRQRLLRRYFDPLENAHWEEKVIQQKYWQ